MKRYNRPIAIFIALAMLVLVAACGRTPQEDPPPPLAYPWVFVHGLNGYGEDSALPHYWGGTAGNLLESLRHAGFECYAPSVSAAGSAWDRAVELFAQLTGTQVDYGIAHSQRHDVERFGTTYEDPLFEGWGEQDEYGRRMRVNLLGHSFGGATIRMLAALLLHGCPDEQAAARAAGEDISPLFQGGKADWIFSITTIAAPHNGVSLLSALDFNPTLAAIAAAVSQTEIDTTLSALGINIPGVTSFTEFLRAAEDSNTAYADLSIAGAQALNERTALASQTYYFSFAVDGTNNGRPSADMSLPAQTLGVFISSFTMHPPAGINDQWRANDGLVNTISATFPFSEDHTIVNPEDFTPSPGIWNVMPIVRGDHGSVIGLGRTMEQTLPLYLTHMQMVDRLSTGE